MGQRCRPSARPAGGGEPMPAPDILKLAILATHPIQYHVPWFQGLAARPELELKVFFSMLPNRQQQGVGFGVPFKWDIPMLEGYAWEVLANTSRSPALGRFFGANTPGVYQALEKFRPGAAIVTGWQSLSLAQGLWACLRLGIPVLVRAESSALRPRPWWGRALHRALLSRFDAFLAIGAANREFYLRNGVTPEKIFSCPYFVDNARIGAQFEDFSARREEIRAEWGIPKESFCFVFVGKLQPKKRILDVLRALVLARASARDLHLLIAGDGELMAEAKAFAQGEDLPVTFAGFLNQTQVPRTYAAGDCLVLPSDYGETWGLVVNEAMVCGLPAIVSDRVGCGPDLVEDGATGSVFPFGNVAALANRMLALAADPATARRMGTCAQGRIAPYSVENAVEGTIRALDYVVVTSMPRGL